MDLDGKDLITQYVSANNDGIRFSFDHKGNNVKLSVYNEAQYKFKQHMPPIKVIDGQKNIMSPMPGSIVSVSVAIGDKVVDGQQLIVIEAMKMQNIIKAEIDGEIESVKVKAGDSVAVDEILITFKK